MAIACQTATPLPDESEVVQPAPDPSDDDMMRAPTYVESVSMNGGNVGSADAGTVFSSVSNVEHDAAVALHAAPNAIAGCDAADPFAWPAPAENETCYEFSLHDASTTTDVTKLVVEDGERVAQLYYAVPWPAGQVATRFGMQLEDLPIEREWIAFGSDEQQAPGTVSKNVTGTTLGTNARLFARGSTGGCNVVMPADVGLELPGQDKTLMIQWLHANWSCASHLDGSKVVICTVPATERAHIASFTWLGTENLNGPDGMPAGTESTFDGTCENRSGAPVTITALWPHMHALGTHASAGLLRAGGAVESILDMPFDHTRESPYELSPRAVLGAGEKIRASCTYFNDTSSSVAFGLSTAQEMCAQLALAYPAGALDKPANPTLIGATNTCWGD